MLLSNVGNLTPNFFVVPRVPDHFRCYISGVVSMSKGNIHRITSFVEQRKTPFAVSRLIMMTGSNLRSFGPEAPDDPMVLRKLRKSLDAVLSDAELRELDMQLVA